jgi:hypothetical protein
LRGIPSRDISSMDLFNKEYLPVSLNKFERGEVLAGVRQLLSIELLKLPKKVEDFTKYLRRLSLKKEFLLCYRMNKAKLFSV